MQITINNITYELMPQPKKPAPYCCDGCAADDEAAVDCEDFKGLCSHHETLNKVWKRVEPNEQQQIKACLNSQS